MLDFEAYVERIGLGSAGSPGWRTIHRAHATSIPFENLDSHRGSPVSLEQAELERKMVTRRRGGYCFEHNLLLGSALEHLGLRVEPMLARVRVGGAPPDRRPLSHLVLRVTEGDGQVWHSDGRVVRRLRLPAASGAADRHRGEQLVDLHQPALALRVRPGRRGHP